jgi:hypothetical protein
MRELAFGPRQTGRTTTLLLTMIEEMSMHNKPVYLIVGTYFLGNELKNRVHNYNEDSSRVRVVTLESMTSQCRGIRDPRDVYIDHTAYELADSRQYDFLCALEDRKDAYVWGDKINEGSNRRF